MISGSATKEPNAYLTLAGRNNGYAGERQFMEREQTISRERLRIRDQSTTKEKVAIKETSGIGEKGTKT